MDVSRSSKGFILVLLLLALCVMHINAVDTQICVNLNSPCFFKKIPCPSECPLMSPSNLKAKFCFLDCNSPICKSQCISRKPNCNGRSSACLDPRFVGADGIVFYFHVRRNEHFGLVYDVNLQINARFIGHRPAGRPRDYTWIQALGVLFDSHIFSIEATPSAIWDDEVDHLKLSYNGTELVVPEGHLSTWQCQENQLKVARTSNKNSVMITLPEVAEISVNVVPVTKEDSRIHNFGRLWCLYILSSKGFGEGRVGVGIWYVGLHSRCQHWEWYRLQKINLTVSIALQECLEV